MKLVVKSSPHLHSPVTTRVIMRDVLIALAPALFFSVAVYGWRSLLLTVVCAASCVAFEYLSRRAMKRDNTVGDLSAAVTGVLLAYNLPVSFPIWMAVLGSFFAIVVVKQLFGGIGQNFVNPAIAARVFLLISFATPMTQWLIPTIRDGSVALVSGATPLALMKPSAVAEMAGGAPPLPGAWEMLLGVRGGCLGETAALALIAGGVYLIVRGVIHPAVPLAFLGTMAALSLLFGVDPIDQLLSGGAVLGAFFMATDYTTSPSTAKGKLIFAAGCGLITMVIRVFGSYPEGVSFSILFMNILVPHINTWTRAVPFGAARAAEAGKEKGAKGGRA